MLATHVLTNGRVHTLDATQPEVTAVALAGNKILGIGDDAAMKDLLGPSGEWVDLGGRCVTPGLVDAHVHFQSFALLFEQIDLRGVSGVAEALRLVAQALAGPDEWLEGRGWNQAEWPGEIYPSAADLDQVAPNHPAYLRHKSGHAAWVNSLALKMAGIGQNTPDPSGGQIQRDANGYPTGILLEKAMKLVSDIVPKPSEGRLVTGIKRAQKYCWQHGLTGIHDFDGRLCFVALQTLKQQGELGLRVVKNIPVTRLDYAVGVGLRTGFGDEWLRIGGIKIFADGALGPRTASMIAPYEGQPENRGIVVTDKEVMQAYASQASANGLSVTVHAIGDRANHDVLDVFEAVRSEEISRVGQPEQRKKAVLSPGRLRHRIEHAQILHPDDFRRMAELRIIASMQPIHATADMDMAEHHLGVRAQFSYAWRTMLENKANLVFGSDAPVDPIEPLTGIYAAVSRRRSDGSTDANGWYPAQRLTMNEAVQAYTTGAAWTSGRERTMGTLTPGKLADMTIYDRDIFQIPQNELLDVRIAGTVIDGRFMYRSW